MAAALPVLHSPNPADTTFLFLETGHYCYQLTLANFKFTLPKKITKQTKKNNIKCLPDSLVSFLTSTEACFNFIPVSIISRLHTATVMDLFPTAASCHVITRFSLIGFHAVTFAKSSDFQLHFALLGQPVPLTSLARLHRTAR